MNRSSVWLLILGLLVSPALAAAQQDASTRTVNPHGTSIRETQCVPQPERVDAGPHLEGLPARRTDLPAHWRARDGNLHELPCLAQLLSRRPQLRQLS
ncbi:MAG: hypothetical protein U0163_05130 [Gemmatimonadaceae bacterium]